jgi:hypothetical protein
MVPSLSGMEDTGAAGWDTKGTGQQAYTAHGTVGHWNARQHNGNTGQQDGNARLHSKNVRQCWAPHSHLYQINWAPCCFALPVTIE